MSTDSQTVKRFYQRYHDQIDDRRASSPFVVRRTVHEANYRYLAAHARGAETVLDAGCGEGNLALLVGQRAHGSLVVGCDLSLQNIRAACGKSAGARESAAVHFLVADAESLPFRSKSFGVVLSSHVLEHLPDLDAGVRELRRTCRGHAVIAMPTCLNPAAWVLLGGDKYWKVTRRTPYALPWGLLRVVWAWLHGEEGVQEGYAGRVELPHVWRFPGKMLARLAAGGLRAVHVEAGPLAIPYVGWLFPTAQRLLDHSERLRDRSVWRNLGYGTIVVTVPVE